MKYLYLFGNHRSYVYCRKVNKLWDLVTLHAIISAFQHDHSCRNTLFPDSVMSENELSILGWILCWNIWNFSEFTDHMCTVERLINCWFWWHCIPFFSIPACTGHNQSSYILWNDPPTVHDVSLTRCKFQEKI